MCVLGAGTGLGNCYMVSQVPTDIGFVNEKDPFLIPEFEQRATQVHPAEGGHCTFTAQNEEELEYLNFIRCQIRKFNINHEQMWCG